MLRRFLKDIFMNEIKVKSFSTPWQCYSSTRDVQSCSKSHIATKDGYLPFRRRVSIFPSTKTMTKTMTKLMTMTKTKAQFLSDSRSPLLSWYSSSKHRHFCQPSSVVFSDLYHLHFFLHHSKLFMSSRWLTMIFNYKPWPGLRNSPQTLWPPWYHGDHPDLSMLTTMVTTLTFPCWHLAAQVAASVADRLTPTQCSVHTTQPWWTLFIRMMLDRPIVLEKKKTWCTGSQISAIIDSRYHGGMNRDKANKLLQAHVNTDGWVQQFEN